MRSRSRALLVTLALVLVGAGPAAADLGLSPSQKAEAHLRVALRRLVRAALFEGPTSPPPAERQALLQKEGMTEEALVEAAFEEGRARAGEHLKVDGPLAEALLEGRFRDDENRAFVHRAQATLSEKGVALPAITAMALRRAGKADCKGWDLELCRRLVAATLDEVEKGGDRKE